MHNKKSPVKTERKQIISVWPISRLTDVTVGIIWKFGQHEYKTNVSVYFWKLLWFSDPPAKKIAASFLLETSVVFRPSRKKIAASFLLETRSFLIVFVSVSETCSFLFLFRLASAFGYPKQPMVPARFCKIGYFSTLQMLHFQFCNQQHIIRRICKRK